MQRRIWSGARPHRLIKIASESNCKRAEDITLRVDEAVLEGARKRAARENSTPNAEFRKWLARFTQTPDPANLAQARPESSRGPEGE